MNEEDILNLIKEDKWMMSVLKIAEKLNLLDWVIGAGFVRNKVWDHLHGFSNLKVDTPDVDLVYYNSKGNDKKTDEKLSQKLKEQTGINFEVINEFYAHTFNNISPYKSTADALSQWPETVTALGIKLEKGKLKLIAPYGVGDLVNLIIRPSPNFQGDQKIVKERAKKKQWLKKWPKLKFSSD